MSATAFKVSDKMGAVILPFDPRVAATMPHVEVHKVRGHKVQVIPHLASEVKLLRNLGYRVPAPILTRYNWCNTVPYAHQKKTAAMLTLCARGYNLSGLGTGKTRSALFAADYLMGIGEVRRVLVVAPLSTLSNTWEREIFNVMPHRTATVLHGSRDKRLAELSENYDFYIINTDGPNVIIKDLIDRLDIDVVIVDELAQFRNKRTRRWKALKKVIKGRKWVWGLTGLPTPNGPTDAWAQAQLLTPERVPKYFKQFQASVEYQITQFKWKPRDEANDIVKRALSPSVRFATKDCIDLPPTTYSTRTAELSPEQKKAYKELLKLFYTEYLGHEINAANAGVKTAKLLQIACGFMYSESSSVVFPTNNKIKIIEDIIDETEQKVLVFAPFTKAVDLVADALEKHYSVERVYGATPAKKRNGIFNMFRSNDHPKVLVAHPGVLSHGLTLVEANTIAWYSPTMSYETWEQANARIVRPGQRHHTHIINIESCSIETTMFKRLANKGKLSTVLLDLFAELTKRRIT